MAIISAFPGGGGGGGIDYSMRPKITFDGQWLSWFVEFYGGEPYWEAWLLSSGTLSAEEPYTADAWGIGGGAGASGSRLTWNGSPNAAYGFEISANIAVSIGAGGPEDGSGGNTELGTMLVCYGGTGERDAVRPTGSRYRFSDEDKAEEAGADGVKASAESYYRIGAGGWLYWRSFTCDGEGYGASGGDARLGYREPLNGHSGALVIRIKMD